MNNEESILVLCSFAIGTVLFVLSFFIGARLRVFDKSAHFDKNRLHILLKYLVIIAAVSIPIGLFVTRDWALILRFIGTNLLLGVIMGMNLTFSRK